MTAALEGSEWSAARPGRTLPPVKKPVPILQVAGWVSGPVWAGGNSGRHWDSIPECPARSSVAIPTGLPGPQQPKSGFFNPLNSELNPISHLLALLGAHHIFHVSGLRVTFTCREARECSYVSGKP